MLSQHRFDSEAFCRNPTDGSFAVLAFQPATFTKYRNDKLLAYNLRFRRTVDCADLLVAETRETLKHRNQKLLQ